MIRKLFRLAVAGFCLLSLLACVGTGWLWWRSQRPDDLFKVCDTAEVSAGHLLLHATSTGDGLTLTVVSGWPGPPTARAWSVDFNRILNGSPASEAADTDPAWMTLGYYLGTEGEHGWDRWPLRGSSGAAWTFLSVRDGKPLRPAPSRLLLLLLDSNDPDGMAEWAQFGVRRSGPMPYVTIENVRHRWMMVLTALPSLLWAAAYGRRAWLRRRRRRLGLCLACGYDLRGSPAGRCSECGAGIPETPAKGAAA